MSTENKHVEALKAIVTTLAQPAWRMRDAKTSILLGDADFIRNTANKALENEECFRCEGTGRLSNYHHCPNCAGTGAI